MKRLLLILVLAALVLPLFAATSEPDAYKKAKALAGPQVEMDKRGYDGKNWRKFIFYLPAPMCAEKEIVLGEGSSFDVALNALAAKASSSIPTVAGASNAFEIHVSGFHVASMRVAIDLGLNGAESFRPPDLNALDEWVQLHIYNPSAIKNGLHVWCPIFYGPALGPVGQAGQVNLFRVAN